MKKKKRPLTEGDILGNMKGLLSKLKPTQPPPPGSAPKPVLSFDLTQNEMADLNKWLKKHNKKCKFYDDGTSPSNPMGAIGGRLTYSFTPTGIGTVVEVICACGEKLDLTDVDSW